MTPPDRLRRCAARIAEAMNGSLAEGFSAEEVIDATQFLLGASLRRCGRRFTARDAVRTVAPMLIEGYRVEALNANNARNRPRARPTPVRPGPTQSKEMS